MFEALKAYDELQQAGIADPRDRPLLDPADRRGDAARGRGGDAGGRVITVEDHYAAGGIGDAVAAATAGVATVQRLAVREIPRSGKPDELLDRFGISARHIVAAVRAAA